MKSNLKKLFVIVFAILLVLGFFVYKIISPKTKVQDKNDQENTQEEVSTKQNILDDNFYSNIILDGKGDIKSEKYVTILSDYSCPWSLKFYNETITDFLKGQNIKKVWLQYDFLVLDEKSSSLLPTEGAYCANEQEKFWEFHKGVFSLKERYDSTEEAFTKANIYQLATDLKINNEQFNKCMDTHKYQQLILMRAEYYLDNIDKLGVPATFLNGKPVRLFVEGENQIVGAIDIVTFTQKITEWLKAN